MFGTSTPGWIDLTIRIDKEKTTCAVVAFTVTMKARPPETLPIEARDFDITRLPGSSTQVDVFMFDGYGHFASKTLKFTKLGAMSSSVEIPDAKQSGNVIIYAVVDPLNKIPEVNRENNNKDEFAVRCSNDVE